MTTLLLYKDIKALNREEHQTLKLQPSENCGFAADTHLVPVAGLEFFQAARHYPLVFIGEGAQADLARPRSGADHRHPLSRVFGAPKGWVIAVISRKDGKVARPEGFKKAR